MECVCVRSVGGQEEDQGENMGQRNIVLLRVAAVLAFSLPTHTQRRQPASMQKPHPVLPTSSTTAAAAIAEQQQVPLYTHTLIPGTMFCSFRQSVIFLPVLVDWNRVSSNMMAPEMYLPRPGVVTSSSR